MSSLARSRAAAAALLLLCFAAPLLAHDEAPLQPHDFWTAWEWNPGVVIPLALSAFAYWRGSRPLWRGDASGRGIRQWEAACFWSGWSLLFLALCSPLHRLGEALFSAHMAQHEILMLGAAPLLVLGRPLTPLLWALPRGWRRKAGRFGRARPVHDAWRVLTEPAVAWFLRAAALFGWHAPHLYQATLKSEWAHAAQHSCFLFSALLFWWALLRGRNGRLGYGAAVLYLFTTLMYSGLLGALLTFSPHVWYPAYGDRARAWGLTPVEDQSLGGLIMWVPAGTVYILAAVAMLWWYLKASDESAERWAETLDTAESSDRLA